MKPDLPVYGNHWFSVQAGACTEIISFPYTPSARHPTGPEICLTHPRIAHVQKWVPFRTSGKTFYDEQPYERLFTAAIAPWLARAQFLLGY